jgi:cell division septal protein FtsQ
VRVTRRRKKSTKTPRRKRSQTHQGYVFEATASSAARRLSWDPLAVFWKRHGGVVLSVLLVAGVVWSSFILFGTEDFFIYSVAVEGNLAVSMEEIFAASGLENQSIFWVHPERVSEAVARLPNIKSAEATCHLPALITIRVVERQAQVVWQWRDRQFWVDDYGVVLQPRGALVDALVVQDSGPVPPQAGGRVDAQAVLAAQQLYQLRPQLRTVTYNPDRGLVLESEGGWPVYLGVGDDVALKLAILEALEADLKKQGIRPEHIDLRYPQNPVYRQAESLDSSAGVT